MHFAPNPTLFFYSDYILNQFESVLPINLIVVKQRTLFHRLHKQKWQTLWMPCTSEDSPRWKTFSKGGLCSPHSSTNMENHELTQCSLSTKRTAFPEPPNLNLQTGLYCCFTSVKVNVLVIQIEPLWLSCAPTNPFHSTFWVNVVIPEKPLHKCFTGDFNHSHFMLLLQNAGIPREIRHAT